MVALERVIDIEMTHAAFRQKYSRTYKGDRRTVFVATQQELLAQLESLDFFELRSTAGTWFRKADDQLASYQHTRTSGAKKARAQTQQLLKSFADFADTYSGIVDLIKQAGAPYGNAAFDTLSLLFNVMVTKSKNEELFEKLVSDLKAAFPQLNVLNDVYPSTALEVYVANVYVEVILFARKTIEYYTSFRVRLLKALGNPSSNNIESLVNSVRGKLAEVNKEAMVLLHARGHEILSGVETLKTENVDLRANVIYLREGNDRLENDNENLRKQLKRLEAQLTAQAESEMTKRLQEMQVALNLPESPTTRTEIDLDKLTEVLENVFPASVPSPWVLRSCPRSPWLRFNHMTEQQLFADAKFLEWYNSDQSSLLFLCGTTQIAARKNLRSTCSWLSPAAVFTARHIRSKSKDTDTSDTYGDICVFHTCHPGEYGSQDEESGTTRAFAVLFWSLYRSLTLSPQQHMELRARASSICHNKPTSAKAVIEKLTSLLLDMLTAVDRRTIIWIILDRVDECELRLRDIMNQLAQLVSVRGPKVRTMVTADAGYKGGKWDAMDLSSAAGKRVIFRDDWDQTRAAPYERATF